MTLEDLRAVEKTLGINIPSKYRDIALNWPFKEGSWGDVGLYKDAREIIKDANGFEVEEIPVPLFIGSLSERLILVNPAEPDGPLYLWDMQSWTYDPEFANWDEFVKIMAAPYGELPPM